MLKFYLKLINNEVTTIKWEMSIITCLRKKKIYQVKTSLRTIILLTSFVLPDAL